MMVLSMTGTLDPGYDTRSAGAIRQREPPALDAAVPRRLLARTSELRARHDLDPVGSRAPSTPDRLHILCQDGAFVDLDLTSQGRVPELARSDRADHIETSEVAAVSAAQAGSVIG